MLTLVLTFLTAYWVVATTLGAIFAEAEAFITLMAFGAVVMILIAVFLRPRSAAFWGLGILFIVVSVAVEQLAPHRSMVFIIVSGVLAILATYEIKANLIGAAIRHDDAWARRNGMPPRINDTWRFVLLAIL